MGEFLFNLILLIACIALLIDASSIQILEGYIGARYWPMFFLALLVILLGFKTVRAFRTLPKQERKVSAEFFAQLKETTTKRFLLAVFFGLVYVLILPKLGFLIATFLFGVAFSWLLGAKKIWQPLLSGVVVSAPIFAVFVWGLNIRLPRGVGVFYALSLWAERLL